MSAEYLIEKIFSRSSDATENQSNLLFELNYSIFLKNQLNLGACEKIVN